MDIINKEGGIFPLSKQANKVNKHSQANNPWLEDMPIDTDETYGADVYSENQDWKSAFTMKSPLNVCPPSGCIEEQSDGTFDIINNKKPGKQMWRTGYATRQEAVDQLKAIHSK